ncbi:MAG: hypothetical protein CMJ31_12060 [Phycisphaerae bacterium]|nr:hypothetical protein [Phycisphaerae bacterium]
MKPRPEKRESFRVAIRIVTSKRHGGVLLLAVTAVLASWWIGYQSEPFRRVLARWKNGAVTCDCGDCWSYYGVGRAPTRSSGFCGTPSARRHAIDDSRLRSSLIFATGVWATPWGVGWLRRRSQIVENGRCPERRYDLTGVTLDRCPECGASREA